MAAAYNFNNQSDVIRARDKSVYVYVFFSFPFVKFFNLNPRTGRGKKLFLPLTVFKPAVRGVKLSRAGFIS